VGILGVYEELKVKRIINACGTYPALGGSVLDEDVLSAMADAARSFVDMNDLEEKAGKVIAEITGAEAGYVSSGAFAGLVLAIAACMVGEDMNKILQLPNTEGMKNEVIIQKQQRNYYDTCITAAGAKIVEVGGEVTRPEDIKNAINDKTAAILFIDLSPQENIVPLPDVVKIAHENNVPVIVDAAAELPPVENLREYIANGADIVVFSGGKDIGGPNDTGIVCGKKKWINIISSLGPYAYARSLKKAPFGRGFEVSKEQIVGLVVALKKYVKIDHKERLKKFGEKVDWIVSELKDIPGIRVSKVYPRRGHGRPLIIPRVEIILDKEKTKLSADKILRLLEEGDPPIRMYKVDENIYINPQCLKSGEEQIIVNRLKEIFLNQKINKF